MNFLNTKINAADFPRLYPHLFASYQVLMRATLERSQRLADNNTEHFDAEVIAAQRKLAAAVRSANDVYSEATAEADAQTRAGVQAADVELNLTLTRLLQEKDAEQEPLRGAFTKQFLANQSEAQTAQECYRELGLPDQWHAWSEQFQVGSEEFVAGHRALLQPSEKHYQAQVAAAYDLRNAKVAKLGSAYEQACNPHALDHKRALRAAESTKLTTLQDIAYRRDEAADELRAWNAGMKQERLQWIESFLQSGDERELQQRLDFAVSQVQ